MRGKIRYQKELQKTYVIAEECEREGIENYFGQMVLRGRIRGLAGCEMHLIDGQREIWYDITCLQPLEQAYAVKEMIYRDLKNLLMQVIQLCAEMEKYLLDGRQLCFEPEFLYWDLEKERAVFLYDFTEEKSESGIVRLAEFILERTCHEEEAAVNLAYFFYECSAKAGFSLKEVEQYLETDTTDAESERKLSQSQAGEEQHRKEEVQTWTGQEREQEIFQKELLQTEKQKPIPINSGKTGEKQLFSFFSVNGKCGKQKETGLACAVMAVLCGIAFLVFRQYYLMTNWEELIWIAVSACFLLAGSLFFLYGYRIEKKEECIEKKDTYDSTAGSGLAETDRNQEAEFWQWDTEEKSTGQNEEDDRTAGKTLYIGKSLFHREYSLTEIKKGVEKNYTISSYPFVIGKDRERVNLYIKEHSVNRIHARLLEENGSIYIEDLHSTNGTYLNDLPLQPHDRVKIKRGDIILFGNAEFAFR